LPRQEGHLGVGAAVVAYGVVHLPGAAVTTSAATAAVLTPGLPAGRTALGLLVTLAGVKFLVVCGERKARSALDAGKGSVGVSHSMTSFVALVNVRSSSGRLREEADAGL